MKQGRRLVCVSESEAGGIVKMQGVEVAKVDMFSVWGQPSRVTDSSQRGEEESADKVGLVALGIRGDLCRKDNSKMKRKGLQDTLRPIVMYSLSERQSWR